VRHLLQICLEHMSYIHSDQNWAHVQSRIQSTLHSQLKHILLVDTADIYSSLHLELSRWDKASTLDRRKKICQTHRKRICFDLHVVPSLRCKSSIADYELLHIVPPRRLGTHFY
jgi:hypothetical protein